MIKFLGQKSNSNPFLKIEFKTLLSSKKSQTILFCLDSFLGIAFKTLLKNCTLTQF